MRRDHFTRLGARHDRKELERDTNAPPLEYPLLQQSRVITFHQLKAAAEIGLHPAIDVPQAFGQHAPASTHLLIDGDHVVVFESLDDHEKHVGLLGLGLAERKVWPTWLPTG